MKKIIALSLFLFSIFSFSQNVSPKDLIGKTYEGVTAQMCAKGAKECSSPSYFVEITFTNGDFIAKNYYDQCGKISIMDTQKGKWKVDGAQIMTMPQIKDAYQRELNLFYRNKTLSGNNGHTVYFYLKK